MFKNTCSEQGGKLITMCSFLRTAMTTGIVHNNRAVPIVGARRGPNFSCKLAVSATRGVILADFHAGGTTRAVFNDYQRRIAELCEPNTILLWTMPVVIVVRKKLYNSVHGDQLVAMYSHF